MKIFISRKFYGLSKDIFGPGDEIVMPDLDRPLTAEEFLNFAKGSDAVLTFLTDKVDGEVMDAIGPQLKVIANYAVGFDNIKVTDANERGIVVTNTPCDEVNEAVAEHTMALLMALARRIVEADESVKRGSYDGWQPNIFLGVNIAKKTLGVIGMGRIGEMVVKRARAFDMKILYNKRQRDEKAESQWGIVFADIDTLLAQSDFVSLHVPLTEATTHLINKEKIQKMKRGSYLINTARGPVVVEQDLADALREGHLAGAALDVFENEPHVNPELIGMENVILTPHIASATKEAREAMGSESSMAIVKTLKGEKSNNIVNPEVWEKRRQ